MFTDLCCDDWDSTKNQEDFIKSYFSTKQVNLKKTQGLSKSENKSTNVNVSKKSSNNALKLDNKNGFSDSHLYKDKRSLNCELESNKKRKTEKNTLLNSSPERFSETQPQSKEIQVMKSSNHAKKKKKKATKRNGLNEFSGQTMDIKQSTSTHLQSSEIDSDFLQSEKKRVKKETSIVSKSDFSTVSETVMVNDAFCSNLSDNDSGQKTYKKKKLKNKLKTVKNFSEINRISDDIEFSNSDCNLNLSLERKKSPVITNNVVSDNPSVIENKLSSNNYCKKKLKHPEKSEHDEFSDDAEQTNFADSNILINRKPSLLQNKAYQKLQAAKFRYLNEMLYTNSGKDALSYFQQNTDEFMDYHQGYQSQVSKWPINPVDIIIQEIRRINKQAVIADLGCGEAKIAEVFPKRTVHSFDLIALKNGVISCDMTNVPLPNKSVHVAVFCLSLMGTNWKDYLKEGHRILKLGGIMKIAEIESRIENLNHFIKEIETFGFSLLNQNLSHKMFVFLNFKKINRSKKPLKIPAVTLKPCLYKKR